MRRHEPRDSPNSTREFGPIEATTRDSRLGPVRTTTQWRDTVRTHGLVRRVADVAAIADFVAGDKLGAAVGTSTRVTVSTDATEATAVTGGFGTLSLAATSARAIAVSLSKGAATAGGRAVTARVGGALADAPFLISSSTTITAANAAPTPYQTRGAMGGRAGWVPHHRHDPALSG
jgi:hypothetical protein